MRRLQRTVTLSGLRWLLGPHEAPCVSIYLPAAGDAGAERDRLRLRQRVDEAVKLLGGAPAGDEQRELLRPLEELATHGLWRRPGLAVAVFRSRDAFTVWHVAAPVPELVVVSTTFHTRPLVRYVESNRRFYVLPLGGDGARLLEGSPSELSELEPDALPPELAAALGDEQGRAALAAACARRRATPAGSGLLARHLAAIDRALSASLEDELAPVILAGPAAIRAQYRAGSRYPELLEDGLDLASAAGDLRGLHAQALRLIRLRDADVQGALLARLESALAVGAAELDLRRIARAAAERRVALLLHASDVRLWGRIDRRTGELDLHDRQRDDQDADVVDDLAEMVLLAAGDVHELPPGTLPGDAPVAALYR